MAKIHCGIMQHHYMHTDIHTPHTLTHTCTDPCREITVGTNVLSCRSEKEWTEVGVRQCLLRTSQGVGLAGVKVRSGGGAGRGQGVGLAGTEARS